MQSVHAASLPRASHALLWASPRPHLPTPAGLEAAQQPLTSSPCRLGLAKSVSPGLCDDLVGPSTPRESPSSSWGGRVVPAAAIALGAFRRLRSVRSASGRPPPAQAGRGLHYAAAGGGVAAEVCDAVRDHAWGARQPLWRRPRGGSSGGSRVARWGGASPRKSRVNATYLDVATTSRGGDPAALAPAEADWLQEARERIRRIDDELPDWYAVMDLFATIAAGSLFYFDIVNPIEAQLLHTPLFADFLNVVFLVRFLVVFWSNGFKSEWLMTGRGALEIAGCLPVLIIAARLIGGDPLERSFRILELARFLRLLGTTLPRREEDGSRSQDVNRALQIITVLVALLGTVFLSATLLYLYENPNWREGISPYRSFDDTVLYMVNVFASRQLPWDVRTQAGEQATSAATLVSILFLPFLVSISIDSFRSEEEEEEETEDAVDVDSPAAGLAAGSKKASQRAAAYTPSAVAFAEVLRRLDALEDAGQLSAEEAGQLRLRCVAEDEQLRILDLCYGQYGDGASLMATSTYSSRLKELLM
eukprot:TRINITY_DN30714_c0_g1_i1.p1 TRINITY_DN30714_c0_g1~~TRINITY_DN30714_c0_g1_i1.p1  ORF type:complete len:534 (+),score=109.34 TRINITY_DN30714_c0_g1_i1:64-1665(+)